MTEIDIDGEKLNRFFKGDYSDNDASYVDKVFCEKEYEKKLEHYLKRQLYELLKDDIASDKNLDHVLYKIHYEINTNSQKPGKPFLTLFKWFSRIAAVLLLPLAIYSGIHLFNTLRNENLAWVEIKAPAWTRAQFSLPDGTSGWLNSSSSVKYKGNFNVNREVILNGEAYFNVIKDNGKPFKVTARDIIVTVSGTRFNIAAYDNENSVEVVLEEGELVCYNEGIKKAYTLKPNDYILYDKILKSYKTEMVHPEKYTAWKEGKLVFRNDPLDVIARRLERWYNIEVEIIGDISNQPRLRATFVDEKIEEVLRLLKLSLPINYNIERPHVQTDGIYRKTKVVITTKHI